VSYEKAVPTDKLDSVTRLEQTALQLQPSIQAFSGSKEDQEYLRIEELLTCTLLDLDEIDVEGNEELRSIRKKAVQTVQSLISCLEAKVN
jgi:hypothetical protein